MRNKKFLKKGYFFSVIVALQTVCFAPMASAIVIGFNGGSATLQNGSIVVTDNVNTYDGVINYVENVFLVEFNGLSDTWGAYIGNYYGAGNAVIHTHWDSLQSVTFSMLDGSEFDLNYMDVTSNTVNGGWDADGTEDSWITASNGTTMKLPSANWGSIFEPQRLWLSSNFDNITSFTVTSNNAYCFGLDNFYINEPPPPNPNDADGDGIADTDDECPETSPGEPINSVGCSVNQLCPCENNWKNHGEYVKCIAHTSEDFLIDGLITIEQKEDYVSTAGQSQCGHKK